MSFLRTILCLVIIQCCTGNGAYAREVREVDAEMMSRCDVSVIQVALALRESTEMSHTPALEDEEG